MNIQVKQATLDQKPILEKLIQLYFYDFSEIFDADTWKGPIYSFNNS